MDLVTLCLGFVVLFMILDLWSRSKRRRPSVDPLRLPPIAVPEEFSQVLGHLPILAKYDPAKSYPLRGIEAIVEKATGNVVTVYPGPPFLVSPIFLVLSGRDAKVLAGKGGISMNFLEKSIEMVGGGIVIGGLPEEVKKQRRRVFTSSMLNKSKISYLVEVTCKSTDRLLDTVCGPNSSSSGVVAGYSRQIGEVTLLAMVEMVLGFDIRDGSLPLGEQERLLQLIAKNLSYFSELLWSPLSIPYWKIAHPFKSMDMRRVVNTLYKDFILPAFYRRLKSREAGNPEPNDALKEMLSEGSLGKIDDITDDDLEHVKREALIVFLTGESVNGAVQWLLYHLSE